RELWRCRLLATVHATAPMMARRRARRARRRAVKLGCCRSRSNGPSRTEDRMRNGFQVYDSDTHVNPAAEVLERYVDPDYRPRLAELSPYRFQVGAGAVGGVAELHNYRVGTKYYRRVLGERAPRDTFTGRETRWMGSKMPRPGVQDDRADNRV